MTTKTCETYEVTVKYDKIADGGMVKSTKETFVLEAFTPTDAEMRITRELTPFMQGEFQVVTVKKTDFSEVQTDNTADTWYLAKTEIVTDDVKGKRTPHTILLAAKDFKEAHDATMEVMRPTMADWEVISLAKTKYVDVYLK